MNPGVCEFKECLGPFVDGELRGADRLRLSLHLEACRECAAEVEGISLLGETLRGAAANLPVADLSGLADGVVTRATAEWSQSWRGAWGRAVQDLRWAVVGAGSLTATFVSTLLVSVVVWQGPARDDSFKALMDNLGSQAGLLTVGALAENAHDASTGVMLVNNTGISKAGIPVVFSAPSDPSLVTQLTDAVTRGGRLVELRSMKEDDRRETEALLDKISRQQGTDPPSAPYGTLTVTGVYLAISTNVTAKGPAVTAKGL